VPRRKPGTLLPIEVDILEAVFALLQSGQAEVHGFGLAQTLRERDGARSLTAHGTLYKALARLEELALLTSRWEDAAAVDGRPRRRLYEVTSAGVRAARSARSRTADHAARTTPRSLPEPA
jgi:PadR family transcriptional regulator PadR